MITDDRSGFAKQRPLTCPTCGEKFDAGESANLPFCSERCQNVDLGRWLSEGYGLPIEGQEESEGGFADEE